MKEQRRKHIPKRTCVVCRRKMDKRRLTRLVRTKDEGVVIDRTGKRNGRGAYLCDDPACWDKAMTSHILDQALRAEITTSDKENLTKYRPAAMEQDKLS